MRFLGPVLVGLWLVGQRLFMALGCGNDMTTTLRRVAVPEGRSGSAGESRCWLAKGGVDSGHASACSIRVAVVGCQLSVRVHEFLAPLSENGQTEPTEHSSPGARSTAPIAGPDDRPLPDSIARVEKVELNGSEQWIMVRGNDASNPVLLNLGMGGPGRGGFFNAVEFRPLEEHFTVVSWDEPGTGKSYGALPFNELNKERYAADAVALTNVLRERFGQQKIFLYGVAWSSILGIWLTHEHPDLYHAFVSSGQMVNTTENDRLGYELALWHVEDQGDARHAEELRRNGPPPYQGDNVVSPYVAFLDVLNEIMGTPRFSLIVPVSGLIESFNVVYPQLEGLDFKVQAPELLVPVYFFVGRHDVNAIASLVEEYYNSLSAPDKKLIWLEGGHGLGSADNQNAFIDEMITQVRPLSRR